MKQVKNAKRRFILLTLAAAILLPLLIVPQTASALAEPYDSLTISSTTTSLWRSWITLNNETKTLTLTDDVEFDSSDGLIFSGGSWTLDLNGKVIIGYPAIEVEADANLTIIGDGRIEGDRYFYGDYVYCDGINVDEGTLTIRGGDIEISGNMLQESSNSSTAIDMYRGTLNIESGNITLSSIHTAVYSSNGTVNISGGDVTMNGKYGMYISDGAMEISGGNITINSTSTSFVPSGGTATISGGTVSVTELPSTYTHTGGVLYNQTTGVVTVSNLAEDYTIPANATLTVAEGETLTLNDGAVLTVAEGGHTDQ